MKKIFIIILLLFTFAKVKAQTTETSKGDTVGRVKIDSPRTSNSPMHISIQREAEFPGGIDGFFRYIKHNLKYPEDSYKKGVQGIVMVSFVVEKDGSLQESVVIQSVSPDVDAEALRLIKNSPKWSPAMQDGKKVSEQFKVSVPFKIN